MDKLNRQGLLVLYTLRWIDKCVKLKLLPKGCITIEGQTVKVNLNERKTKKILKNFNPSIEEIVATFMGMAGEGIVDVEVCNDFIKNNYPSFLENN